MHFFIWLTLFFVLVDIENTSSAGDYVWYDTLSKSGRSYALLRVYFKTLAVCAKEHSFRYTDGGIPVARLNILINCDGVLYPHSYPISRMGRSLSASKPLACSTRVSFNHALKGFPISLWNKFENMTHWSRNRVKGFQAYNSVKYPKARRWPPLRSRD